MKPFRISRRHLLRGLGGIAIALPVLEAMGCDDRRPQTERTGKTRQALSDPTRFLVSYIPDGVNMNAWYATGSETSFTLNPSLAPLKDYQSDLIVLRGVDGIGAGHFNGLFGLLSGVNQPGGAPAGITVDQYIAQKIGNQTRLPSLSLGVCTGPFDTSAVSAIGAGQAIYGLRDPKAVFQQIVGDKPQADASAVQAAIARRKSVLDGVIADYDALSKRVSSEDRKRLDQHLTHLRNIESKLGSFYPSCDQPMPNLPVFTGYDAESYKAIGPVMMELAALAFACDATRVISVMWNQEGAGGPSTLFSFLDPSVTTEHHELSHGVGDPAVNAQLQEIDTWHTKQFAYLLKLLKEVPSAGGKTLLDSCALLYGSGLSDGAQHSTSNLPLVLAGSANGRFKTGRYLQLDGAYSNDLLVSIMNAMGVSESTFGDPTHCRGPLQALAG